MAASPSQRSLGITPFHLHLPEFITHSHADTSFTLQYPISLALLCLKDIFILSPSKGSLPSIYCPFLFFWLLLVFPILLFHTEVFSYPRNLPQKPCKDVQRSAAVHRAKPNENVNRDQQIKKPNNPPFNKLEQQEFGSVFLLWKNSPIRGGPKHLHLPLV